VDANGAGQIVDRLESLHRRFSPRFKPAEVLVKLGKEGGRFYPEKGKAGLGV
jgi:hypothetical protein